MSAFCLIGDRVSVMRTRIKVLNTEVDEQLQTADWPEHTQHMHREKPL